MGENVGKQTVQPTIKRGQPHIRDPLGHLVQGRLLDTVLQLHLKSIGYTGAFVGSFMLVLGIRPPHPFGMISDRMKRRKIMALGIAFVSAAISLVIARTEMNALLLAACI
jgi:MFS family permease